MFKPFVCATSSSCTPTLSLPLATLPPILLSFWIVSGSPITYIKPFSYSSSYPPGLSLGPHQMSLSPLQVESSSFSIYFILIFWRLCFYFYFPQHFILGNYSNMLLGGITLFYFGKLPLFHFVQFHDHMIWYLPVVVLKYVTDSLTHLLLNGRLWISSLWGWADISDSPQIEGCNNDGVWLPRPSHKRHCSFSLNLSLRKSLAVGDASCLVLRTHKQPMEKSTCKGMKHSANRQFLLAIQVSNPSGSEWPSPSGNSSPACHLDCGLMWKPEADPLS